MRRSVRVSTPPAGFRYQSELVNIEEERGLLDGVRALPLTEFEFHGYLAKRRVMSFGFRYRYDERILQPAEPIPAFLLPLRERAAVFAGCRADALVQSTVAEYGPGTAIGWHRDKPVFGDVIGVSLCSSCVFRFRRRLGSEDWERYSFVAEPRSAYRLSGAAREEFEHSIPEVASLRYSITFRTLRRRPA
ncbi:MAG TPA: alpha-ketoglutarate-dependent dioxygenase AlkB [Thermoanaerobaculia bacterium]